MLQIISHDEHEEIDGVSFVRTSYMTIALETPERFYNQHAVQRRPVCRHRMWRYFNIPFVEQTVNAEYFDQTFLHVPKHYARILRWLSPPRKREPNIVEQYEAEKDFRAFSDEVTLTQRLSLINERFNSYRSQIA